MNGKEWLDVVAGHGCILCRVVYGEYVPAAVHHIRDGAGMAQRAPDFLTLPLCPECHQGRHGIHGDRQRFKLAGHDELSLLAILWSRLLKNATRASLGIVL